MIDDTSENTVLPSMACVYDLSRSDLSKYLRGARCVIQQQIGRCGKTKPDVVERSPPSWNRTQSRSNSAAIWSPLPEIRSKPIVIVLDPSTMLQKWGVSKRKTYRTTKLSGMVARRSGKCAPMGYRKVLLY